MMSDPVRLLKRMQIVVAVLVLMLVWLVVPALMVAPMTSVAFAYILATVFAMANSRFGVWLAFLFTVCAALLASIAGVRLMLGTETLLYGPAPENPLYYGIACLAVAAAAWVVVGLHIRCREWMKQPG